MWVSAGSVWAKPGDQPTNDVPFHVTVSPSIDKIALEAGARYDGSFLVTNTGNNDYYLDFSAEPYFASVIDNVYTPDYTAKTTWSKIVDWIVFDENHVFLGVNEAREIGYSIAVPADPPAGGQYALISANPSKADDSGARGIADLAPSVGMLLMAQIAGTLDLSGRIEDFRLGTVHFGGPITGSVRVINDGNADFEAVHQLTLTNFFSGEVAFDKAVTSTILPEMDVTLELAWDKPPFLGIFRAQHSLAMMGDVRAEPKLIFILPLWLIIFGFIVVALLVVGLVRRRRFDKINKSRRRARS
jgi:hypothetical protein